MRDETCSDRKESVLYLGWKMPPPQMDRDPGAGRFQTCAANTVAYTASLHDQAVFVPGDF